MSHERLRESPARPANPVAPFITVVLPCFNEEQSVGHCVEEALGAMCEAGITGEVIVVDNNSTDNSINIALGHGARVLSEPHRGYGSAIRAGIEAARGEIVVMADADMTYELSAIPRLLAPILAERADLVIGERLSGATHRSMPFLHRFAGTPLLSLLIRRASGNIRVRDSQSGFRAFRRSTILEIGLTSTGMEFASEMLIRAARAGLRIEEIPTSYRVRIGSSKLKMFSDGLRHLRQILLLAPHLMLITPGVVLFTVGVALQVLGFVEPGGVLVGSLRWQPVFFAGIALVIGLQTIVVGLALRERSRSVGMAKAKPAEGRPLWMRWIMPVGMASLVAGGLIDSGLFLLWVLDIHGVSLRQPLASLASSMLIDGISLVGFAVLQPLVYGVPMMVVPRADAIAPEGRPKPVVMTAAAVDCPDLRVGTDLEVDCRDSVARDVTRSAVTDR